MTLTTAEKTARLLTDFDQLDITEALRNAAAYDATALDARDRQALALLTYAPGLPAATRTLLSDLAVGTAALPLPTTQAMHLYDAISDDILGPEPEWPVQEAWLAAREVADAADEPAEPAESTETTPFDAATLTITSEDVHALAQPEGDVLAWDHHAAKVRAMTREEAIASGFVAFTNRGWLNDWTRDPDCWNDDHTGVTPECAEQLAGVLTEWLRRIA